MIKNKALRKICNYISKIKHLRDKYIVISMGENCLADNVLSRYDLKTFSSPFSSGRSNIEYILNFEKEKYIDFVNPCYLNHEMVNGLKVARNKKYVATKNQYNDMCMQGMEFTHHDVIGNDKKRKQIVNRCKRLQNISNRNIVFVYHHRYCRETDMELLISCFEEIKQIYESRNNSIKIFIFTQELIADEEERKIVCKEIKGIQLYVFHTLNIWEGDNQEIFWAMCDDDLMRVMIEDIREYIKD